LAKREKKDLTKKQSFGSQTRKKEMVSNNSALSTKDRALSMREKIDAMKLKFQFTRL